MSQDEINYSANTVPPESNLLQLLFLSLCLTLCIVVWIIYHGDPRKKDYEFFSPALRLLEVIGSILYNCITEAFTASSVVVLVVGFFFVNVEFMTRAVISLFSRAQDATPSLRSVLDLHTLVSSYLSCALFLVLVGLISEFWNLYCVQREKYRISIDPHEVIFSTTLGDALSSNNFHTRHIAFYDLKIIVETHEPRIHDLLKLTHPGCHPYAWNTILTPITSLIGGSTLYFKDFITFVRSELEGSSGAAKESSDQNDKITSLFGPSSKAVEREKNFPRLRDLAIPTQIKVTFHAPNEKGVVKASESISPAKRMMETPSLLFKYALSKLRFSVYEQIQTRCMNVYLYWFPLQPINKALEKILQEQQILVWATQILVGICQFSITKDMDGVVSTTVAKMLPPHIDLYYTLEQVIEDLKPVRDKVWRKQLQKLVNLLTEYKKSLVFFHVNYAPHAEILRIPPNIVRSWERICATEVDHNVDTSSQSKRNELKAPTLFN